MWPNISSAEVFFSIVKKYLLPRKREHFFINWTNVSSTWTALSRRGNSRLRPVQVCYRLDTCPYIKMKLFHGGTKSKLLFILGIKLNFTAKVSQNAKLLNQKVGRTYGYHYVLNWWRKLPFPAPNITKDTVGRHLLAQLSRRCEMKSFKSDDKWFLIIQ
jgi:hypothetical protein